MNAAQANEILGELLADLKSGRIHWQDLGPANINGLLKLIRQLQQIDLDTVDNRHDAIDSVLKAVVKPWLQPANQFMQKLQSRLPNDDSPADWDAAVIESTWDDSEDMEVQQWWLVTNERLKALMHEHGCMFIQIEELCIWCNTTSEVFGSGAMQTIGEMLCAGTIDTQFNKVKS